MNNNILLQVRHLAKSYGRQQVLQDISFGAARGEIVAIMGENGAGKSTLLKILAGLLPAERGDIELNGTFGYCPQETWIFERLTVAENIQYFYPAYGRGSAATEKKIDKLMDRFNCGSYRNTLVNRLSGGTKQKLNLLLSLLADPQLLILDEPYAAFDWQTYLHFWEMAGEWRTLGKSIVIVSHIIYDRSRIDTLYELKDGRLQCV
jgi:ABC-2 type transport system ATP-binding protein